MLFKRRPLTPSEIAEREAKVRQRMARAEEAEQVRVEQARLAREHAERQITAAGISSVNLICHKDTWGFAVAVGTQRLDWIPVPQDRITLRPNNMLEVHLSGPQLVKLLRRLWDVSRYGRGGDAAIAVRLYRAIALVVDSVSPDAPSGAPVPPIVVDDQVIENPPE